MLLSVKNLNAGYENKKIIDELSLNVEKGEIVTILGPNGSGKSTLLNCLTRYIRPMSGKIFLENEDIYDKSIKEFSKRVAILSQHNSLTGNVTVKQLISYGRLPHKKWYERKNKEDYEIVKQSMEYTDTLQYENKFLNSLSGGEQQRVWIAMALAQTPDLLLLDEPTTYLDISHQIELMKLICDINRDKNITVIMVLHDLNQASQYSDKIVLMKEGKIYDYGIPKDVINYESLKNVYNIKCHIHEHYRNLERNENVAFMMIEDESFSENLFVRKRVSFRGKAKKILDVPEDIKKKFETIHGENMMNLLYKMDFNFFEINITSGRLVEGFGKAFDLIYENGEWKRENVFSEKANHR